MQKNRYFLSAAHLSWKGIVMISDSRRFLVMALVLCALSVAIVSGQQASVGWKDYLGGPDGSHYSPLKQITPANVGKLEVAWTYDPGDGTSVFCPLVVDNIAYISAKGGALVALDATTGKELWVHPFASGGGGR